MGAIFGTIFPISFFQKTHSQSDSLDLSNNPTIFRTIFPIIFRTKFGATDPTFFTIFPQKIHSTTDSLNLYNNIFKNIQNDIGKIFFRIYPISFFQKYCPGIVSINI